MGKAGWRVSYTMKHFRRRSVRSFKKKADALAFARSAREDGLNPSGPYRVKNIYKAGRSER